MPSPGQVRVQRALAKKRRGGKKSFEVWKLTQAWRPGVNTNSPSWIRRYQQYLNSPSGRLPRRSPSPPRSRVRRSPRTNRCQCQTAQGKRCSNKAKPGYVVCGRHMNCKRYSP